MGEVSLPCMPRIQAAIHTRYVFKDFASGLPDPCRTLHLLPQVNLAKKKTKRTMTITRRTIKPVVKPLRMMRMFKHGSNKSSEVAEDARIVGVADVVVLFARAAGLRPSRGGENIQMEADPADCAEEKL